MVNNVMLAGLIILMMAISNKTANYIVGILLIVLGYLKIIY